jgi:hypothetical protein
MYQITETEKDNVLHFLLNKKQKYVPIEYIFNHFENATYHPMNKEKIMMIIKNLHERAFLGIKSKHDSIYEVIVNQCQ